jgi:hypothetical protein
LFQQLFEGLLRFRVLQRLLELGCGYVGEFFGYDFRRDAIDKVTERLPEFGEIIRVDGWGRRISVLWLRLRDG